MIEGDFPSEQNQRDLATESYRINNIYYYYY